MNRYITYCVLCCIILLSACQDSEKKPSNEYIFLGHIYRFFGDGGQVDKRIEAINFDNYKGIWLGGDLCTETSMKKETLSYLNDLFDLSNPKTHWALGNHDIRNGNLHWIKSATKRDNFYAAWEDGFSILVLNTNFQSTDCAALEAQFQVIESLCDTISQSSHLVILHHHAIWGAIEGLPSDFGNLAHGNYQHYRWHCRSSQNRFKNSIYPMLVTLEEKGIDVYCISGDAGNGNVKGQHFESSKGVEFLTSGIGNSQYLKDPEKLNLAIADKVLVFEYDKENKNMHWRYQALEN